MSHRVVLALLFLGVGGCTAWVNPLGVCVQGDACRGGSARLSCTGTWTAYVANDDVVTGIAGTETCASLGYTRPAGYGNPAFFRP